MKRWIIIAGLIFVLLIGSGVAQQLVTSAAELVRLSGLIPPVRVALQKVRQRLIDRGIRTAIRSTRRTQAQQDQKVAEQKSDTANSYHLLGRAVDMYVFGPDGELDLAGKHENLYRIMHQEGAKDGFTNISFSTDYTKPVYLKSGARDLAHMQWTEGLSFAQAKERNKELGYA